MFNFPEVFNRLIHEEEGALDQWISVLVLAILAIIIFLFLRDPISQMLNNSVSRVGTETNNLFNTQTTTGGGTR
ncbi:MAG: hypothetical protein SFT81_02075 [Candidatus Caenarcaniphilales bacterium]|nr:hypothetical protein [Candidatus Caenarcaniphilales bacterium]